MPTKEFGTEQKISKIWKGSNTNCLEMESKDVINIQVTVGNYDDFVANIINLATNNISSYVCIMNVHMFVEAHNKKSFKAVIDNADIVTPDGKPISWALRLLKKMRQERVAGMDLLPSLLNKFESDGLSVFFYGGTQHMLSRTSQYLKNNYPGLKVSGFYSPPFRKLTEEEEVEVITRINGSGANAVFVVLGCPKQERWMSAMKGRINAVMIGIGGALPVMVGMQKRAPEWMQDFGMEWLFRLYLEPKRLFKRYALTNSAFNYLVIKEIVKNSLGYTSFTATKKPNKTSYKANKYL